MGKIERYILEWLAKMRMERVEDRAGSMTCRLLWILSSGSLCEWQTVMFHSFLLISAKINNNKNFFLFQIKRQTIVYLFNIIGWFIIEYLGDELTNLVESLLGRELTDHRRAVHESELKSRDIAVACRFGLFLLLSL